jgi:shikimate kinase
VNVDNVQAMRIFLTGVGCVGKTTVGRELATLLNVAFFDLDYEIEQLFGTSIERLQEEFLTIHSYRDKASEALVRLLARPESQESIIALPPSGLMGGYLRAIKKSSGITVALIDKPENILARITFYDRDSNLVRKDLTAEEKRQYLKEIKKDITYFKKTYERADLRVDIEGMVPEDAARRVWQHVEVFAIVGRKSK